MKLAPVEHHLASTVEDAAAALVAPGARVLAGGQSLIPMLASRATACSVLVDINRIAGLDAVSEANGHAIVGATARQSAVLAHPGLSGRAPVLAEAGRCVAQEPVRNRGTVIGSLAHADPNAELVAACLVLDAVMVMHGPGGDREASLADFLAGPFCTTLRPGEIVTAVRLRLPAQGSGQAFVELTRTHNSPAIAGAAVVLTARDGAIDSAAVALCGAGPAGFRSRPAERALIGVLLADAPGLERAAALIADESSPVPDVHGSANYRARMAVVVARRALLTAAARAARTKEQA